MYIYREKKFTDHDGKDVEQVILRNQNGMEVVCSNYGCIISAIRASGINIVLGFDEIKDYLSKDYMSNYPFMGCIIGRFANRIAKGSFEMDGARFNVSKNIGDDHLHGGWQGFGQKVWDIGSAGTDPSPFVTFRYLSKDGEEGFPGNLETTVTYTLNDLNELIIECTATTDKPTTVNLTQHSYFNLNGEGRILNHSLKITADKYLGQDDNLVADGSICPVKGTALDFTHWKKIHAGMDESSGYDQTFELEKGKGLQLAAEAIGDKSRIQLQVFTTEPAVHFYTGKGIPLFRRNGKDLFGSFSGFCLETQKHPNAVNVSHFPNTILRPGEVFSEKTILKITQGPVK